MRPGAGRPYAMGPLSVLVFFRLIWLASLAMVSVGVLAADVPQVVGKFERSDGVIVSAVEMDMDGVVAFIGYTCWFELSDGTKIYRPDHPLGKGGSCVVRTSGSGAYVYNFPLGARTFPVANQVLRFDGHQFTRVETPWNYWVSPVVHTIHYSLGYLFTLVVFTPFLLVGGRLVQSAPWRGYSKLVRVFWIVLGLFIAFSYGQLLSIAGPIAPWIWFPLLAIWTVVYWWGRKTIRNTRTRAGRC